MDGTVVDILKQTVPWRASKCSRRVNCISMPSTACTLMTMHVHTAVNSNYKLHVGNISQPFENYSNLCRKRSNLSVSCPPSLEGCV
jgi:hypothetical protein